MTKTPDRPAFPRVGEGFGNPAYDAPGMTIREAFAMTAPVSYQVALNAWNGDGMPMPGRFPNLADPKDAVPFFECWARLRYQYADAMIAAGSK